MTEPEDLPSRRGGEGGHALLFVVVVIPGEVQRMLGADNRRWRRVRLPVLWDGDSEGGSRGSRTKDPTGSRLHASRLGWFPGTTRAGVRGAVPPSSPRLPGRLFQLQVSQDGL